jgi:hypothetical protein
MTDLAVAAAARIQANPQDLEAWSILFLLMANSADHAGIQQLVTTRQHLLGDGIGFFYYVARDLLAAGRDEIAEVLLQRIGTDNILLPVAQYLRGLLACRRGRADEAVQLIRAAAQLARHPAVLGFAARDRLFTAYAAEHIAAQAGFLLTRAEMSTLAAPSPSPAIDYLGEADCPGMAILVAACDRGYFNKFAPDLVASAAAVEGQGQTLHLHVVDPDAETAAQIAHLLAVYPFLRISTEAGRHDSTYYACSRFLVAPALLDRYRRPLIAIDVDVTLARPVATAMAALGSADLGWLEQRQGVPVPSLICDARLVALADSAGSRRFLDRFGCYVATMLARGARWMVDQAGLWCLSRSGVAGCSIADLAPGLGPNYGGIVIPADASEAKQALRKPMA